MLYRVVIDGNVYSVCSECAKMGKVIGKVEYGKKERKPLPKVEPEFDETVGEMLVPDYGEVIRRAREKRGMSRKDLARALSIKEGLLAKIENQELLPEDRIRKKIEKFLGIKLTYSGEERMEEEELELYIKAGKIAREAKEYARKILKAGISAYSFAEEIEKFIERKGGKPAFPVNLAVNDEAAHYSPKIGDERKICSGDVLKVDLGVHVEGCIADTAFTVEVGGTKNYEELVLSTKEALEAAVQVLSPGIEVREIGGVIERVIRSKGFKPIWNLSGHQIERWSLHAGLSISNVREGRGKIVDGMVVAIEPFASNGRGRVKDSEPGGIYRVLRPKRFKDHKLEEFLQWIYRKFGTLPFSERWCLSFAEPVEVKEMLNSLWRKGAIMQYRVLKEKRGSVVSQHEHTIVLFKGEKYVITRF